MNATDKVRHWCGSAAIFALKGAPVLEFGICNTHNPSRYPMVD